MPQLLELALGPRRSTEVPFGARFKDGRQRLRETFRTEFLGVYGYAKLNSSQFLRLSQELEESFPVLRCTQVQLLKDLCHVANYSEEFFLSVSKDQWLRTAIICDKDPKTLFSIEEIERQCRTCRITIQSIVVPCHPYWPKLQAARDEAADVASKRLYFPLTFLEDALSEDKSLVEKLNEWEERNKQFAVVNQLHDREGDEEIRTSRPLWDIRPDDVVPVDTTFREGGAQADVGKISWRKGIFAIKTFNHEAIFDAEVEVVRRLSHPHIVYSFGVSKSADKTQHSLLMELLDGDLFVLIEDRVRLNGRSKPPFRHLDSVDILLQIAKAMAHMHELDEPVIHGDLKPQNILVGHCEVLGDICQFFVKVADFGSARILNSSATFEPVQGTTKYSAPEVLVARSQKNLEIKSPQKIDVYSFGVLAFQVLTGFMPYEKFPGYEGVATDELKKGVIGGSLRPALREACSRPNFWNDPDMIALVESCWDPEPFARPCFSCVTNQLESIYKKLIQRGDSISANLMNGPPTSQANAVDDGPENSMNGAHAFSTPPVNVIGNGPENSMNGAHAFSTPPANAVDDEPEILMHGADASSPPQEVSVDDRHKNRERAFSTSQANEEYDRPEICNRGTKSEQIA